MRCSIFFAVLLVVQLFASCKDDNESEMREGPVITLDAESARYRVKEGRDLVITPTYDYVDEASSYVWKLNQKVVGRESSYTFNEAVAGEYFLKLQVMNDYGVAEEELKITVLPLNAPMISLYVPEEGFKTIQNQELVFAPEVENGENATYVWKVNGVQVASTLTYTFKQAETGTYQVSLTASSDDGEDQLEFVVNICDPSELPFSWSFPQTEFNLSEGRSVKVKAYLIENDFGGVYTWTLDGNVVGEGAATEYVFEGKTQGVHRLVLTMKNEHGTVSQEFSMNVCPPEGTYRKLPTSDSRALINRVYEFMPAPGHQVNGYMYGASYPANISHAAVCDTIMNRFERGLSQEPKEWWSISLGACGGYVIVGFDHSVENSGDYDLIIGGNPYGYQSEPGIIWVSQDENGDGLPNDTWYELKGSEYGGENQILEYAITYYQPTKKQVAIKWTDNLGKSGIVPHMTYWNPSDSYYQSWLPSGSVTFYCSRLVDHSTYVDGYSSMPAYPWGYTDNLGSDYFNGIAGNAGYFKISNAVTFDGKAANLKYIDFVKIQTAPVGYTPNLGEISTEVKPIFDYHLYKE